MSPPQIHTLWACSLLVISPPTERTPQGGSPTDLAELNLLGWATLVQDVAAGLQVLPPNLSHNMGLPVVALLQLLEVATRIGFCHHCYHLGPWCKCVGASQLVPPASWSQIVEQTPGYGVTTSSGGMTTPSTLVAGVPGYVAPPPGLTSPDLSIWSLPPQEVPLPPRQPAPPLYWPPMGRTSLLRAVMDQQAQMLWIPAPQAPTLQAPALRATAPWASMLSAPESQAPLPQAPQTLPPLHQPLLSSGSQLATPYQQAIQLPVKPKGRGVTFDTSAGKVAAISGQDANGRGRQRTHDRHDKAWPASPGRSTREGSSIRTTSKQMPRQVSKCSSGTPSDVPRDSTPGSTLHQHSSSTRASKDPQRCVAQFRSQGWKKDLERIFWAYCKYNFTSLKEAGWNKIRDKVLDHLLPHQEEWRRLKEDDPLQCMPDMEEQFYAATGIRLEGLAGCTAWIKHGSYYHSVMAQKGQLDKCPHLAGIEPPKGLR